MLSPYKSNPLAKISVRIFDNLFLDALAPATFKVAPSDLVSNKTRGPDLASALELCQLEDEENKMNFLN